MKKYIIIGALFLGLLSCEDTLTEKPSSYYDANKFFTSVENAEMSVIGVYNVLSNLNHYGQFEMAMPTSDDMYYIPGTNTDNTRRDIAHYMLATNNAWIEKSWNFKYQGLDRANFALEGIRGMSAYKDGNKTLLRYEGELAFLRAFLANEIIKYWGDVPFKTSFTTSIGESYQPRTPREEIYEQIEADLRVAIAQLPWASERANPERATQGAARAMMMRTMLQKAGYSLKADGQLTQPSEEVRKKCFEEVVTQWNAIKENGYHNFFAKGYEQVWQNYSADVDEPVETLWEIAFYTPDGKPNNAGMWGTYIGPQTDQGSSYGRANTFFNVLPTWKSFYDDNDVRRDVNICQYKIDNKDNKVYNLKPYKPATPATSPDAPSNQYWYVGKWRREWMKSAVKDPNNTDVDYVILRYADAVLMSAEAYNELGNTAEAITLLNTVRSRAGVPPLANDWSNYKAIYKAPKVLDLDFIDDSNNQGKFRTALYWERGFELCFEGTRKFDLIRWGVLQQSIVNMYKFMEGTKSLANDDPKKYFFAVNQYAAGVNFVSGKHELFPIPLMEIQRNYSLESKNNPQY